MDLSKPALRLISTLAKFAAVMMLLAVPAGAASHDEANVCDGKKMVTANVVALDQPLTLNRPGASVPGGMIYALARDVFPQCTPPGEETDANSCLFRQPVDPKASDDECACHPGLVRLGATKRPRPIVLRANKGECVEINLTNLVAPAEQCATSFGDPIPCGKDAEVAFISNTTRSVGMHVTGLSWTRSYEDDGSWVGENTSSLVAPGSSFTYQLFAEQQGPYFLYSTADDWSPLSRGAGGEGTVQEGLFGALHVEPSDPDGSWEAEWYRSQVTEQDLCLASTDMQWSGGRCSRPDPASLPEIDYAATYPEDHPRAGLPILAMERCTKGDLLQGCEKSELVHTDLTAIITGPGAGKFPDLPAGEQQPSLRPTYSYSQPDLLAKGDNERLDPYREFTIIYHENYQVAQAFPYYFASPNSLSPYTPGNVGTTANSTASLGSVGAASDSFGINYGFGGLGATVLSNRLGLGPMADCTDCKYEEFFLTSWSNGDPAMVVDNPAANCVSATGEVAKECAPATMAHYPADPSNVYHGYLGDHVRFRILHAGPDLHHLHHQHAHQWLGSPNTPDGDYLDSQSIGPGAAFTLEIAYHGSGNVNQTVGDSIFHCHFYPHFASGMWALWRVHDVFEAGTELDDYGRPCADDSGSCSGPARALPDSEIATGTPIPALVPRPRVAMPPLPAPVRLVQKKEPKSGKPFQQVQFKLADEWMDTTDTTDLTWEAFAQEIAQGAPFNPGYPFFIPGIPGSRPPHPPADVAYGCSDNGRICDPGLFSGQPDLAACADPGTASCEALDGGLPRHVFIDGKAEFLDATLIANGTSTGDFCSCPVAKADDPCATYCEVQPYANSDFHKTIAEGTALGLDPGGTIVEKVAMGAHSVRFRDSITPEGEAKRYLYNGLPPQPGAPYADPCIQYRQEGGSAVGEAGSLTNRYMAVNLQIDAVFNEAGWHFPQQRIISLWGDAFDTLSGTRRPEPLFMRVNSWDCMEYVHANLVPNVYELDDFQVRTPTDILGQHIHLVKFDVTSSDGAANGFNYEDGTFAPNEVTERIAALNKGGGLRTWDDTCPGGSAPDKDGFCKDLTAKSIPFFGAGPNNQWIGATATIQRWYDDPLLNNDGVCANDPELATACRITPDVSACERFAGDPVCDPSGGVCSDTGQGCTATNLANCGEAGTCIPLTDRTLRTVFTHDHYGPSTHQQAGLYAGVVAEPKGSIWRANAPLEGSPAGAVMGGFDVRTHSNLWCSDIGTDHSGTGPCDPDKKLPGRRWATFDATDKGSGMIPPTDVRVRDGGPTSWEALIDMPSSFAQSIRDDLSFREFLLEFQDSTLTYNAFTSGTFNPEVDTWFAQVAGQTNECPGEPCGFCSYTGRCNTAPGTKCLMNAPKGTPGDTCPSDGKCVMGFSTLTACSPDNLVPDGMDGCVTHGTALAEIESCNFIAGIPSTTWQTLPPSDLTKGLAWNGGGPVDAPAIPEGITFDGGTNNFSVNYRNEPLYLRTTDPQTGESRQSSDPRVGDMGFAYASIERPPLGGFRCAKSLNAVCYGPTDTTCGDPAKGGLGPCQAVGACSDNNNLCTAGATSLCATRDATCEAVPYHTDEIVGRQPGDPYTPLMRAYAGDDIQIRTLVGAHINPHNMTMHGMNWLLEPAFVDSSWRNSYVAGISEHFELVTQVPPAFSGDADYLFKPGAAAIEQASGSWNLIRAYQEPTTDLPQLPQNPPQRFSQNFPACPSTARKVEYTVAAVSSLIDYNYKQQLRDVDGMRFMKTNDPALICSDPDDPATCGFRIGVEPVIEPLVLRANAGDCIEVTLHNLIDPDRLAAGFSSQQTSAEQYVYRDDGSGTPALQSTANAPLLSNVSQRVGLHPQLVTYDVRTSDGANVGLNPQKKVDPYTQETTYFQTAPIGGKVSYTWYAGHVDSDAALLAEGSGGTSECETRGGILENGLCYIPIEFGGANLLPPDPINHHVHGLFGGLVIEPADSSWDPAAGTTATITTGSDSFTEFVSFFQDDPNLTNGINAMSYKSERLLNGNRYCDSDCSSRADVSCAVADAAFCKTSTDTCVPCGEPLTPVYTACAGDPVRFRFLHAGGANTNNTIEIYGHTFPEYPAKTAAASCFDPNLMHMNPFASQSMGDVNSCFSADWLVQNPPAMDGTWPLSLNEWKGSRTGHGPTNHFDAVIASAGGPYKVPGDYLVRSYSADHFNEGIWGIFRVDSCSKTAHRSAD